MSILPGIGGLIQGAAGIAGSVIQNRGNQKLANQAQQYELEMWNKSNEYNSPQAQMKRLQQAGLNPNLVYGTGNVSGQTSSPAPRAHIPEFKAPMVDQNLGFNILNSAMQLMKTQADTDNIRAIKELNVTRNLVENLNVPLKTLQIDQGTINNRILKALESTQVSLGKVNLSQARQNLLKGSYDYRNIMPERYKQLSIANQAGEINLDVLKNLKLFKESNPYLNMILNILSAAGISK